LSFFYFFISTRSHSYQNKLQKRAFISMNTIKISNEGVRNIIRSLTFCTFWSSLPFFKMYFWLFLTITTTEGMHHLFCFFPLLNSIKIKPNETKLFVVKHNLHKNAVQLSLLCLRAITRWPSFVSLDDWSQSKATINY
jgi:hypothetical protein